ncbi:hypothetical protein GW17_00046350 [Ensete ventricosum]|nr:hypothetical protein GW17_00046350 [Ensete ventricosum]
MTRPTRLGSPHRGRPRRAPRARSRGRTPTTHGEIPSTTRRRFPACLRLSPGGSRKLFASGILASLSAFSGS